jgi:hypothetical protein
MGSRVGVRIGETLSPADLAEAGKRHDLMEFLWEKTHGLAGEEKLRRYREAHRRFQQKKPLVYR